MVAKGLDFENVTLVGVLAADLSLYVDSFRSAERTFSLLTQVVGRAGRGGKTGRAVIQTYTPDNDVIVSAARQDYEAFYTSEIRMRRIRREPPFADLFTLTVSGLEEGAVLRAALSLRDALRQAIGAPGAPRLPVELLGPAPAPILKLNNRYRYRLLWVGKNDHQIRELLSHYLNAFHAQKENRALHLFIDCNGLD
jgi:primosomal protein N' (replication factor Y)